MNFLEQTTVGQRYFYFPQSHCLLCVHPRKGQQKGNEKVLNKCLLGVGAAYDGYLRICEEKS